MTALNYLRRRSGRALQFLQPHKYNVCNNLRLFLRYETSFVPKRVLIVSKLSRYHFEKMRDPGLSDEQLRAKLKQRGSDYDVLWASHVSHENVKNQVTEVLRRSNIEYKIMNRNNLNSSYFSWADLILPIGGDGTLLLASNMISDSKKPIIGINSHPERSEGFLMLPPKYTYCIPEIFEMLRAGNYKITMRRRIRTTIMGDNIWDPPFHTHEKARVIGGEKLYAQHLSKDMSHNLPKERRLPWLALNEVFVAETLSAKMSTLLIKLDNEEKYKLAKGSGICVSTGTGSTSWYKAIISVTSQTVQEILSFMKEKRQFSKEEVDQIARTFNDSLVYGPEDLRLCYVIRDMIISDALPVSESLEPRGFCNKLTVRSHCYDAGIVIDGGIAVPFNFGSTAVLESYPEDSLQSLILTE